MNKLYTLLSIGQSLHGKWVLGRLISHILMIIGLALVSAIMCGGLALGCFYAFDLTLQHYGVEPYAALLIVLGTVFLFTLALILFTMLYVKRLRETPHRLMEKKSPLIAHAGEVVDAFIDGFLNPNPAPPEQ